MQKLKFGIQITALILAFPLWFLAEMKEADREMKKNQIEKQDLIETKKAEDAAIQKKSTAASEVIIMPDSRLMVVNI